MEIEVRVPDFYRRWHRNTLVLSVVMILLTIAVGAAIAWMALANGFDWPLVSQLGLAGITVIQLAFLPLFINSRSQPFAIVTQAIAHVSKDPIQTPLPDVNAKKFQRNGLRSLVQTVYELAAKPETVPDTSPTPNMQYGTIFNNAPVGLVVCNASGAIVAANSLAPVRRTPDNVLALELLFDKDNNINDWLAAAQTNKLRDTNLWPHIANKLPGEQGRHLYDVVVSYAKNSPGGMDTVIATIDRTAQYLPFEEDMDFIALAAHELRGPITVIRGYLDIAATELHQHLDASQQELFDRLEVSAEQLSGYINNILNVARYDRHHLQLHLREESLMQIFREIAPGLLLRAKTKRRKLAFSIPNDLPTIAADASSLGEVINNLVDNAIKYSPESGEIDIKATINGEFIEVTVQDFGIGIPENIIGNLFSKFYRSHRSREQVGGTGLGLYICKAIIESHGGHIWVRSQEGKGSTFGFTIPIYSTVAQRLANSDNKNGQIIERREGWIKNHSLYLQ